MEQKLINQNQAIRNLMDNELMIGKHRPLISQWYQKWVKEFTVSRRMPESEDAELMVMELKAELLKEIEEAFSVKIENKIALDAGWRKGTPIPKNAVMGKEVTVSFFGFANEPRN